MVKYTGWNESEDKAASVQRKLKDSQKSWKTILKTTLKTSRRSGYLEANYNQMTGDG